jgi:hypothetical protein
VPAEGSGYDGLPGTSGDFCTSPGGMAGAACLPAGTRVEQCLVAWRGSWHSPFFLTVTLYRMSHGVALRGVAWRASSHPPVSSRDPEPHLTRIPLRGAASTLTRHHDYEPSVVALASRSRALPPFPRALADVRRRYRLTAHLENGNSGVLVVDLLGREVGGRTRDAGGLVDELQRKQEDCVVM